MAFYCILQVFCINNLTLNYDEPLFAAYGTSILKFQGQKDIVRFESKLPITALNMIPRAIEQILHPYLKKTWNESIEDIIRGRYISLFVSVLLGLLIFKWTKELYSPHVALFCLLFYLVCPNFLAHGIFVSPDIFACFFMTLALYYLWRTCRDRKVSLFILMSVATGLAQISKFSMVHLFLIIPAILIAKWFTENKSQNKSLNIKKLLAYSFLFLFINWLIICSSHLFYQVFLPMKDYSFRSNLFKTLQHLFPGLTVPLPSSYISSMDAVMYFDHLGGGERGSIGGAPYLLGKNSTNGFWYYYFVVIFFKMPISVLLLWVSSITVLFRKCNQFSLTRNAIFLLLPVVYYLIYLNFFYSTQIGIRHVMIIFPLLYILSGSIVSVLFKSNKKYILIFLLTYQTVSVFMYFPHFLPYTNEFIIDKKMAYKKIADTNLCYGEGKEFLKNYLAKNPDAIYMPRKPEAGKVILEINEMLNLDIATVHKYDWGSSLVPVDHIHSQYLIFDLSKRAADSLQKTIR